MLVIVVGNPCSGKTSLRIELQKRGYFTVEASEYFKISQKKMAMGHYNPKIPSDQLTAYEIFEEYGEKLQHAVLVGIRTIGEYVFFHNMGFSIYLVSINCGMEICYERAIKRNREYVGTYDEFINNRINPDKQLGLDKLLLKADSNLENCETTLQSFLEDGAAMLAPYIEMD